MSSRLPAISGRAAIKAFARIGYTVDRQRGSHVTLVRNSPPDTLTIPVHRKEIPRGTLRAIIRQAGLSVEEFRELLSK